MVTANAVRWYLRWLLLRELESGVVSQADMARAMNIKDSMLSQLKSDARGAGLKMLDYFAGYYRKSQTEIMEEARKWYANPKWQHWVEAELGRITEEKLRKLQGRARERRTISSERPSVKALMASPVDEADGRKK
jgi:transcriptional regulator with XRE-family HTH domain